MKVHMPSAGDVEVVSHRGFLLTCFCCELHATICRTFEIDKNVPSTDAVEDGTLREVLCINDGRRMTDSRAYLGLVIGIVVITTADASDPEALVQLVLPKRDAGARPVERSAIDRFD